MYSILATSFTSPGENCWPSNWMWEDTHSSTRHSRNCFYKDTCKLKLQLYAKRLQHHKFITKCKSCLRTASKIVMSHKTFSLQGLYNLHTGHAPSPSSSGFRRLSPPGQPWRSSNTSNRTRAEQSVIAAKVSHSNMFGFGPFESKKGIWVPNCTSNASTSIICLAC